MHKNSFEMMKHEIITIAKKNCKVHALIVSAPDVMRNFDFYALRLAVLLLVAGSGYCTLQNAVRVVKTLLLKLVMRGTSLRIFSRSDL